MKRIVTVTLTLDPTEYHEAEDTPIGAIDIVLAALRRDTDIPTDVEIRCENVVRRPKDEEIDTGG